MNRETFPWIGVGWGGRGGCRLSDPRLWHPCPTAEPCTPGVYPPLPFPPTTFQVLNSRPVIEEKTYTHWGHQSIHSDTGCVEICHLFTCEQTHGHLWPCLPMCKASHTVKTNTNALMCTEDCSIQPWLGYIYSDIQLKGLLPVHALGCPMHTGRDRHVHTLGLLNFGHAHILILIPIYKHPILAQFPPYPAPLTSLSQSHRPDFRSKSASSQGGDRCQCAHLSVPTHGVLLVPPPTHCMTHRMYICPQYGDCTQTGKQEGDQGC